MHKKKLIVDFDDTIVESIFLQRVNRFLKTNYTFDDFQNYYIDEIIKPRDQDKFYSEFCDTNPYFDVELIKDAKEVLYRLSQKYDVYICSGCVMYNMPSRSAQIFSYKYDYIIKTFPFLSPQKFIFTNSKEVLQGDIIVDDFLGNLTGNFKEKYLFTSYHNKSYTDEELKEKNIIRVDGWKDIEKRLL